MFVRSLAYPSFIAMLHLATIGCGETAAPSADPCAEVICDDANDCTEDACATEDGTCVYEPVSDGAPCDLDGAAGICALGQCAPSGLCEGVECDDEDLCTTDLCDPMSGQCFNVAQDCDDGDLCTTDFCEPATGLCSNVALDCDDGDACTDDSCDPSAGCSSVALDCDDGDACTDDSCDPATGCSYAPRCIDGNLCTGDLCRDGVCTNPEFVDGTECVVDDIEGICVFGLCRLCLFELECDDGNDCTVDTCGLRDDIQRCFFDRKDDGTSCTTTGGARGQCRLGLCLGVLSLSP